MFVIHYLVYFHPTKQTLTGGFYKIFTGDTTYVGEHPSDCIWIVPGTITE